MAWNFDFAAWIRKQAKLYTDSVVSIGGVLTDMTRRPTDGHLLITFTPTTGSPIIFDAGEVPQGPNGEAAELQTIERGSDHVLQYRYPTQAPTDWTDLYTFPSPYTYTHNQATPADVWNIQHNLGGRPVTVLTVDGTGEQIVGQLDAAVSTSNLTVIRFSEPIAGTAYIKF
jgi:hypothetical protein